MISRKVDAEIVYTLSPLCRKRWDATEVSKDGTFVGGAEGLCWIGGIIVIF
jgi:hypothetical protein